MSKRRLVVGIAGALTIFFATSTPLLAQDELNVGTKPYAAFHEGDIDRINLFTRSLDIRIPIISYPQRGGKLHASWDFILPPIRFTRSINKGTANDSRCNNSVPSETCYTWNFDNSYFQYSAFVQNFSIRRNWDPWGYTPGPPTCNTQQCYTGGSIIEGDGTTHLLAPISSTQAMSIDGTGYLVSPVQWQNSCNAVSTNPPVVIIDRNGLRHTFPCTTGLETIEDTNGNQIQQLAGNGFLDSMGRTLPNISTSTTDFSNCTGPLPTAGATLRTLPGVSGGSAIYKVCYANLAVNWSLLCHGVVYPYCSTPYVGITNLAVPQSLVLPNLTAYTFEYIAYDPNNPTAEGWGDIKNITLPTGATISYTYVTGSTWPADGACSDSFDSVQTHIISMRAVDPKDGNPAQTWTYSSAYLSTPYYSSTTVTDPLGSAAVHNFGPPANAGGICQYFDLKAQYYQSSATASTLLKTVTTAYSSTDLRGGYILGDTSSEPAFGNVFPTSITTTWGNGQTSQVQKDYDSGVQSSITGFIIKYGDAVAEREYDYGNNARAPYYAKLKPLSSGNLILTI
jgi:hypothetical protein